MKIAFYDTRPYDKLWFDPLLKDAGHEPRYIENRLDIHTLEYLCLCQRQGLKGNRRPAVRNEHTPHSSAKRRL